MHLDMEVFFPPKKNNPKTKRNAAKRNGFRGGNMILVFAAERLWYDLQAWWEVKPTIHLAILGAGDLFWQGLKSKRFKWVVKWHLQCLGIKFGHGLNHVENNTPLELSIDNRGDRFCPQFLGLWVHFEIAFSMAYKWGWNPSHLRYLGAHPPSNMVGT